MLLLCGGEEVFGCVGAGFLVGCVCASANRVFAAVGRTGLAQLGVGNETRVSGLGKVLLWYVNTAQGMAHPTNLFSRPTCSWK